MKERESETMLLELRTLLRDIKPNLPEYFPSGDHFKNDWGLDSLDLVEYAARIEHHYRVVIPDQDLEQFVSLDAIVSYLQAKWREKNVPSG